MTDPASLTFGLIGVVGSVIQVYGTVTAAYDLYIQYADFSSTYEKLRMELFIERQRLENFKDKVLLIPAEQIEQVKISATERARWSLIKWIFQQILEIFKQSNQKMESYGQRVGLPAPVELPDEELIKKICSSTKSPPKRSFSTMVRKFKFVVRDKTGMEQTIRQLSTWNDKLDSLLPPLVSASCSRQLRTQLSTDDTKELHLISEAAESLEHWDILSMARARTVIELGQREEAEYVCVNGPAAQAIVESNPPKRQLEMAQVDFCGKNPFPTDLVRPIAVYKGEKVIVDWRCCQDESWRKENPKAFRARTEDLTRILNSDLGPLDLAVLHCVGYFDQSSTVTGYAFRPPPGASPDDKHVNLQEVFANVKSPNDIPDLGDRYELAKALVSTIFEIHNLGWMHKNIQPINILFWPQPGTNGAPNLRKPYLVGFDISRPNQPGEITEKPPFRPQDDVYRHPNYKNRDALSFQPSFDVYSLGVLLWEIGRWINFIPPHRLPPGVPEPPADPHLVQKSVTRGELMQLKRLTGTRYQKVVAACLSKDFDIFWTDDGIAGEEKLRAYLDDLRQRVVEPLALCNA